MIKRVFKKLFDVDMTDDDLEDLIYWIMVMGFGGFMAGAGMGWLIANVWQNVLNK